MSYSSFEIIVIGGGPAGSSCATFLSQRGHKVLLLEKEIFPRFMVGESLLPAMWDLWGKLGILERLEAVQYPMKRGVNFRILDAGSTRDYELRTDEFPEYFIRPYTFHVDRANFDQLLLENSHEKGVEVREGCRVEDVLFEGKRAVGVRYTDASDQQREVRAQVVVDATGRSTLLARKLGRRYWNPDLKKVSYYTQFEGAGRRLCEDGSTMTDIHTTEGGWIWYIPLRKGISSVGVVLDATYVQNQSDNLQQIFDAAIAGNELVSDWLSGAKQCFGIKNVPAVSYLSDNFVGDGFVMIGDAAMFLDPIFSAGVTFTMRGAEFAAEAISKGLRRGDTSENALKPFEEKIRYPVGKMYKMILNWYRILESKDKNHVFELSRTAPLLRERLVVLLSGGYDKVDLEPLIKASD